MLHDDIRELLKELEPDIEAIKTFWGNSGSEAKYTDLKAIMEQESFWQNPDRIKISQEFERIKTNKESFEEITSGYSDSLELLELLHAEPESSSDVKDLLTSVKTLGKSSKSFKIKLLLSGEHDTNNCYISINSGAGGTESQDWAGMLYRMYTRFCERQNFKSKILDYQAGEEAGIKSVTLAISGPYAYGLLKAEIGVHRLVRISPFDSNKRRHTSFASFGATPELPEEKIEIDEKDLRIDTYRAGGAGGQHVNKTDSAVRITHIPTNIVVQCQNERSQLQNKQTALKMLMARLVQKQEEDKRNAENAESKAKIEWGSQIRSYVLHPYKMVKDTRTGYESSQPDQVLDGDLQGFIESYLLGTSK